MDVTREEQAFNYSHGNEAQQTRSKDFLDCHLFEETISKVLIP